MQQSETTRMKSGSLPGGVGREKVPDRWWESAAAIKRFSLKPGLHHDSLSLEPNALSAKLDELSAQGFSALEIVTPWDAGISFGGLDTRDHYHLEPGIGTVDDFRRLVRAVHSRGMAIVIFGNMGYCAADAPFFLKACDAIREGRDAEEGRWFLWSDTPDAPPPVEGDKVFLVRPTHLPGSVPGTLYDASRHEFWEYSERAECYYWTKWAGVTGSAEDGTRQEVRLPQYNWASPEFRQEVARVIRFWMETGVDGWVLDAVNWYAGCDWESNRKYMTAVISGYGNAFVQPEGAGGFHEDPVSWITEGGYNCVQDYDLWIWWIKDSNIILKAIESGDPRPIEGHLHGYHDRVREAGGVLYYCFETLSAHGGYLDDARKQHLYVATVAALGDICAFQDYRPSPETAWILKTKGVHPSLHQLSTRRKLPTDADHRFYAFLRAAADQAERMLVVLNYGDAAGTVAIDCSGVAAEGFADVRTGEHIRRASEVHIEMPAYGYRFLEVLPSRA